MAYDITPKTQPANMDYENSKNFNHLVQVAHDESQLERQRRANQPSKYTQTLQAINTTLQTVNSGLQVAENVSKMYDQITERSFKQEQLEKQNRLKEKIQGAINEHDWNTVATLAMADMQTASQMPEYMSMLGSMAKIEGNEGSAAILKSINTEQQGKIELEEIKNLGKLQVENLKGNYSLRKQALSNQGAMQRAMYNQSQQNARFNTRLQYDQDKTAFTEEGRNIRLQNRINANANKSGKPTRNNFGTAPVNNTTPPDTSATIPPDTNAATPKTTGVTTPTESNSYINNFRNKTYNVPLTNSSQNEQIATKQQQYKDASNAPTKQEQEKANQQNKELLKNQQKTSEFVSTFQNRELGAALDDLDVDGVSADEQITTVLKNPDKYDVQVETEPYKINNMINGGDGLKNPLNSNLTEKYNNVVSIATVTDKTTGKSKRLYFNTQQANLFDDMRKYNKQYPKKIKEAMGEEDSTDKYNLTNKQFSPQSKRLAVQRAISNHNIRNKIVSAYGIPSDPYIVSDAIDYLINVNPKATPQEIQNYVSISSVRNQQDKEFKQINEDYSNRYQEYSYPPITNNPIIHQLERQRSDQLGIQDEDYLKEDLRNLGIIKSETEVAREKLDKYLYDKSNQDLSNQESSMIKDLQELHIILTTEDELAQLKKREEELVRKLKVNKINFNEDKLSQLKKREEELVRKLGLNKINSNEDKLSQLKKREEELVRKLGLDKVR